MLAVGVPHKTQNASQVVQGFHEWAERHVGEVPDNATPEQVAQYFINPQRLISNDLHYLDVGGNGTPGGTTTTETQSVGILGYISLYKATHDPRWLEMAETYWEAYFKYFFLGKPLPNSPKVFRCQWMLNGKQPFNGSYPYNPIDPGSSGFLGEPITFTNGFAQIPQGTPNYGDMIQQMSFCFDGNLIWQSVDARVRATDSWEDKGKVYEIEWYINSKGEKLDSKGDLVDHNPENHPKGTVKLSGKVYEEEILPGNSLPDEPNFTGSIKVNYATTNGPLILRNAPFEPRPIWTPVAPGFEGNSADSEAWWADACHQLAEITGDPKYDIASKCAIKTLTEYSDIDLGTMYWRKAYALSPFTDGYSYSWQYPKTPVIPIERNLDTYLVEVDFTKATQDTEVGLEVSSVSFKVDKDSEFSYELASENPIKAFSISAKSNIDKSDSGSSVKEWILPNNIKDKLTTEPQVFKLPVTSLVAKGGEFFKVSSTSPYGDVTVKENWSDDIVDTGRGGYYPTFSCSTGSGGSWIGFYHLDANPKMQSITYRTRKGEDKGTGYLRYFVEDSQGKSWMYRLPKTNGQWVTMPFQQDSWEARGGQTYKFPVDETFKSAEVDFYSETGETTVHIDMYALNALPELYDPAVHGPYLVHNVMTISGDATTGKFKFGDVTVEKPVKDNLAYAPGIIPFSSNYNPNTGNYAAWRGQPYTGYQYGWVWRDDPLRWGLLVKYHKDASDAYPVNHGGVMGPTMPAYVWDRWDNDTYGPANSWQDHFFTDYNAWSGYFPRAFLAVTRMYQDEHERKGTVTPDLAIVCDRWFKFLAKFIKDNNGVSPNTYEPKVAPRHEDEFVGHMVGNYLSGCCQLALAGYTDPDIDSTIESLFNEILSNWNVELPENNSGGHDMNGAFSGWVGGGQFFGFWLGDIMKGLGYYMQYQNYKMGRS